MKSRPPAVLIFRTVFPLASEAFLLEQIRNYTTFLPIICRRSRGRAGDSGARILEIGNLFWSLLFTVFGILRPGLVRELKRLDIRLVHAHFLPDGMLASSIARQLGVPLVVTCHGSDVTRSVFARISSGRLSDMRSLIGIKRLRRCANLFIAVSGFLEQKMRSYRLPANRTVIHHIGIDSTIFSPTPTPVLSRPVRFVSIARHEEVKGLDVLLRAFKLVIARIPNAELVQIGAGSLTEKLKYLSDDLGLAAQVKFLGEQPHDAVLQALRSSDCLVLASRRARDGSEEAFGIVLLEASAVGLSVIGTKVGGIPEAIEHGRTGFLVEPDSPEALAERMCEVGLDSNLGKRLGSAGREFVVSKFDIARQTRRLEEMYSALLAQSGAGPVPEKPHAW